MVANVVRLVRAIVGVVHEIGITAPVVPKPDAFLRWVAVEKVVVLFRQRTDSACVQNTTEPLVGSAALIRVQMQHPLSVTPCLRSQISFRSVKGAPKQIHYSLGSCTHLIPVIRH